MVSWLGPHHTPAFQLQRNAASAYGLAALVRGLAATGLISTPAKTSPPSAMLMQPSECMKWHTEEARLLETDHFSICYDTSYEVLRPLIGRLEGTYDAAVRYCNANRLTKNVASGPFSVLLFERYEDFTQYLSGIGMAGGSIAGIYDHRTNMAAFVNVANSPSLQRIVGEIERIRSEALKAEATGAVHRGARDRRKSLQNRLESLQTARDALVRRFNRCVVQHEAVHQLYFNIGVHRHGADNPSWVTEGLACQFEVPQMRRGKVLTGINHIRLADFRDALGAGASSKHVDDDALRQAVESGKFLPFRDLISMENGLAQGSGNPAYRYSQAWALVYYLNRVRTDEWSAYLRRLSARSPGEQFDAEEELGAFSSAFGPLDAIFERAVVEYTLGLRFDAHAAGR